MAGLVKAKLILSLQLEFWLLILYI